MPYHNIDFVKGAAYTPVNNIPPRSLINMFVNEDGHAASFPDFKPLINFDQADNKKASGYLEVKSSHPARFMTDKEMVAYIDAKMNELSARVLSGELTQSQSASLSNKYQLLKNHIKSKTDLAFDEACQVENTGLATQRICEVKEMRNNLIYGVNASQEIPFDQLFKAVSYPQYTTVIFGIHKIGKFNIIKENQHFMTVETDYLVLSTKGVHVFTYLNDEEIFKAGALFDMNVDLESVARFNTDNHINLPKINFISNRKGDVLFSDTAKKLWKLKRNKTQDASNDTRQYTVESVNIDAPYLTLNLEKKKELIDIELLIGQLEAVTNALIDDPKRVEKINKMNGLLGELKGKTGTLSLDQRNDELSKRLNAFVTVYEGVTYDDLIKKLTSLKDTEVANSAQRYRDQVSRFQVDPNSEQSIVINDLKAHKKALVKLIGEVIYQADILAQFDDIGLIYDQKRRMVFVTQKGTVDQLIERAISEDSPELGNNYYMIEVSSDINNIVTLNRNIFLFLDTGEIHRYVYDKNISTNEMERDLTFNYKMSSKFKNTASTYRDLLLFLSENDKLISLNGKRAQVEELTNGGVPNLVKYESVIDEDLKKERKIFTPKSFFELSMLGNDMLLSGYRMINLSNGTWFYHQNQNMIDTTQDNLKYSAPYPLISDGDQIVASGSMVFTIPREYEHTHNEYHDYFSPQILVSDEIIFAQVTTVNRLEIVFSETSDFLTYDNKSIDRFDVGVFMIKDSTLQSVQQVMISGHTFDKTNVTEINLDESQLTYKTRENVIIPRYKDPYVTHSFARIGHTNIFRTPQLNFTCRSMIVCLRFNGNIPIFQEMSDDEEQKKRFFDLSGKSYKNRSSIGHRVVVKSIRYHTQETEKMKQTQEKAQRGNNEQHR